jgi:hypothetical protein
MHLFSWPAPQAWSTDGISLKAWKGSYVNEKKAENGSVFQYRTRKKVTKAVLKDK